VVLDAPGLVVKDAFLDNSAVQYLIWQGRPQSFKFSIGISPAASKGSYPITVLLFLDHVPVGSLVFTVVVDDARPAEPMRLARTSAKCFKRAFLSYSSGDRPVVLTYAHALKAAGISFFHDLLEIEAVGEEHLNRQIDECELFLLFWSAEAAHSERVKREALRALARRVPPDNIPEIVPIILQGPPIPKPPPAEELKHLQFNEALRYVIAARKF